MRAEWSSILVDLVVKRRPGQMAQLYHRTQQIITDWEGELIPDYLAHEITLEAALMGSEHQPEQRVQGWRHQELLKRKSRRHWVLHELPPGASENTRAVEPLNINPPAGRRQR